MSDENNSPSSAGAAGEDMPVKNAAEAPVGSTQASETEVVTGAKKSNKTLFIVLGVIAAVVVLPVIVVGSLIALGAFTFFNAASEVNEHMDHIEHVDHETITFEDEDGNKSIVSTSKKLPEDLPAGVKIEDGTVTAATRNVSNGKTSWVVSVELHDSMESVLPRVKEAFNQNGWEVTAEMEASEGGYYTAESETHSASISFGLNDHDGTNLSYYIDEL